MHLCRRSLVEQARKEASAGASDIGGLAEWEEAEVLERTGRADRRDP